MPARHEVRAVLGPAGRPTVTARARPGKCGRAGIGPVYIPTPSHRNPSHSAIPSPAVEQPAVSLARLASPTVTLAIRRRVETDAAEPPSTPSDPLPLSLPPRSILFPLLLSRCLRNPNPNLDLVKFCAKLRSSFSLAVGGSGAPTAQVSRPPVPLFRTRSRTLTLNQ